MKKAFRIIFLVLMPILFVALLAICLSFEGSLTLSSSVVSGESGLSGKVTSNVTTTINLNGSVFNIENWIASVTKNFKYAFDITSGSFSLVEEADGAALNYGEGGKVALQMYLIIGLGLFGIGFFLVEVGYGSKLATIIGTALLCGGSVLIFTQTKSEEGLHYSFTLISESGQEKIFGLRADWLNLNLVAGLADSLSLLNLGFVLFKRKKNV